MSCYDTRATTPPAAVHLVNIMVLYTQVIKERRQLKKAGKSSSRRDLLDLAMEMHDDQTGLAMDDEQLCAQVFTFLVAGHETTSVSMSWTLYELAKYPEIQEKIRREANEVLGVGKDPSLNILFRPVMTQLDTS